MTDVDGDPIPWEACITLNDNWGYCAKDHHYKSSRMIIRNLVECVSKGGNLIVNVGPNAKGQIPEPQQKILRNVGRWMRDNSASVYGCGKADFAKPEWGRYTQNGKKLYAHVYEETMGNICLPGLAGKIDHCRLLKDGSEVFVSKYWNVAEYPNDAFLSFDKNGVLTFPLPDENDTVIEVTLK